MKWIVFFISSLFSLTCFSQFKFWEDFNSTLLIEIERPYGKFICTGVAVSQRVVLTAAHCLEGKIQNVRVFNGALFDKSLEPLMIDHFKLHPDYDSNVSRFQSDLAKIKLKKNLPSNINIHPIHQENKISQKIFRFGFGERNQKNIRTVITLTIKFFDFENKVLELHDDFSVSGDSGGPIFIQEGDKISIIAIHSTLSYGPYGNFSFNPLLSTYYKWIMKN